MAYSSNPFAPSARRKAVKLVLRDGLSNAQAARKTGVHRSTIGRWLKKAKDTHGSAPIPTLSSRPHKHPQTLPPQTVARICELRYEVKRCAVVIHHLLKQEGFHVSLSSVERTLRRKQLTKQLYRGGSYFRKRTPRPAVDTPGDLVQADTIHFNAHWGKDKGKKHYLYTLIDLKSRWAVAMASPRQNPEISAQFVLNAQKQASFLFKTIQTDNGQEFSSKFEALLNENGIQQRRIRLGKKNDNAHIERFNRTIQDECLGRWPTPSTISRKIEPYLDFYNNERLHLSLQCQTPSSVLRRF